MLAPFLWMVTTSLKNPGEVSAFTESSWRDWIPVSFVWKNYARVFQAVPFLRFYFNSIFVTVCTTVGQVATSAMAAYAFARLQFPGRDKIFFGYLATMMVPGAVTMIPVFILLRYLGWVDTYKAMIFPGIFSAYGTFMLRQFFLTMPRELEDAAKIDGCSYFGIFWKIILPLSKPALATLTTFTFMGSWMNFMWPLIVINTHEKFTLPVGLSYFQDMYTTNYTLLMAGSMMMILPILIVFMFNQRFFVEGIKLAGLKG
ncbi:MAG: carbohydrate ABC transporter permease [Candidatus Omnitrophica bacterium]|nr:carbohydrate ABC transporter permease [Candidatus Omnitrophota bacterium]